MLYRRLFRLLMLLALSPGVCLLFQAPVAYAHAFVIGSSPVDGSTVATAPGVVRIFFNEDISPDSIAHVFDPNGRIVDARRSTISSTDPRELDTPLLPAEQLPQGGYLVRWTALSSADGHTTQGAIGFNNGHSSTGLPGEVILGPSTSNYLPQLNMQGILAVAWEWLVLAALTLWIGILVMEGLVLGPVERPAVFIQARKQALPLQWLCLAGLLMGEIINLLLRSTLLTQALGNNGIDPLTIPQLLFETNYGYLWLIRIALLILALVLLRWTTHSQNSLSDITLPIHSRRSHFSQLRQQVTGGQDDTKQVQEGVDKAGDGRAGGDRAGVDRAGASPAPTMIFGRDMAAGFVIAGAILVTFAPSGDIAQLAQPHVSAIVLNWLYLAALCTWLGGAAYMAYVLLPLLPVIEPESHAETLTMFLRRYTPLTLGAPGVLFVSGLFLSEASIGDVQQLVTDPYGRTLLVKILLLALMFLFSGYVLVFLRPRLTRQAMLLPVVDAELPARRTRQSALERTERGLRRTMILQTWLGAGVLLCASLMSFFAPPIVFPPIDYTAGAIHQVPTGSQLMQTKQLGDLSVALQVTPGRVNYANTVIVNMYDSAGNPVTNAQVQLTTNMEVMDMGAAHMTINGGNPTYLATFARNAAFSMDGTWDIAVRISRPDRAAVQGIFQVTLGQ